MASLKFIQTQLVFACIFIACSTNPKSKSNVIYYKKFEIFQLSGVDTIPTSRINTKKMEFVKVSYDNNLPTQITYHFINRQVVLKLDSNFRYNNRDIYIYSTGNLLGGKPGKQREYSFHYIDNGYKLFIDLSDTILVKRFDNIDIRSGGKYHYMVDVYTKNENNVSRYSLLQADSYTSIQEEILYKFWSAELKNSQPEVITNVLSFPPK